MASLAQIKEVRARSGVGLDACRSALEESGGDVESALELLKRKGVIKAAERAGRLATDGRVFTYVHGGSKVVGVVEINCETDFAAKSDAFLDFGQVVAMQVVASAPLALNEAGLDPAAVATQVRAFIEQMPATIPEDKRGQILEGKCKKWYSDVCLLDQESVVIPGKTIEQLRTELVVKIGENVTIRRFARWEVGEGI
jgi:elongation factor Ts